MPRARHCSAPRCPFIEPLESRQLLAALLPGYSERLVAANIPNPTAMQFAPDGRLFVTQQTGELRVIQGGRLQSGRVLRLPVDSTGERGLLGLAFDPNFATNNFIYLHHTTRTAPQHNRITRYTLSGNSVVPRSGRIIVRLDNLTASNHNGGAIHFGPDGKLFVAVGDNANPAAAQSLGSRFGKILRYNPNGTIPADNPFYNDPNVIGRNKAIWALGLRNPFTFDIQPGTGRMHINDVGQNTWEEINVGAAGVNYGWPATEGPFDPGAQPGFTPPLFAYPTAGGNCAITGGVFYNPPRSRFHAALRGDYFFADFCGGWIRRIKPDGTLAPRDFASGIPYPVDLKVGADGSLYYLQRGNGGRVYRILRNAPAVAAEPRQAPAAMPFATGRPIASADTPSRPQATAQR